MLLTQKVKSFSIVETFLRAQPKRSTRELKLKLKAFAENHSRMIKKHFMVNGEGANELFWRCSSFSASRPIADFGKFQKRRMNDNADFSSLKMTISIDRDKEVAAFIVY